MSTIYVKEQGATVRTRNGRIVVTRKGESLMDVPLAQVERLAVIGNVQVTTPALTRMLAREVDVVFLSTRMSYRGRLDGGSSKQAQLRIEQLRALELPAFALELARPVILGKMAEQRNVLKRRLGSLDAEREAVLRRAMTGIDAMRRAAEQAADVEALRGCEGKAAVYYFGGLRQLLDPAWGFRGRAYRPAPDPFNAALSFGYALLQRDAVAAVNLVGLDPHVGFMHTVHHGRPSLALDLMEEFRPSVVDVMLLELLRKKQLGPGDFEREAGGPRPVSLSPAAVEVVLRAYEDRMNTRLRHRPSKRVTTWRRCVELQARQVAGVVLGRRERYEPLRRR